jgi:hypothetical protein
MYCADCGTDLGGQPSACPQCGREPQQRGGAVVAELGKQLKASSRDAAGALRSFGVDPVGGLAPAFSRLGPERAGAAGVALCVAFALAGALGIALGARRWLGAWGEFVSIDGAGLFFKALLGLIVIPAALTAVGLAVRKVLGKPASGLAGDAFTAGAALVPMGLAMLLGGVLGAGNVEIALLLYLFALSYLVLLLYSGLTGVGGLSPRAAAPAVPVMLVLAGWLSKVVFAALM